MKRLIAIILVSGLFPSVNAQTRIGLKAGINFPHFAGDDASSETKSVIGLHVGAVATITVTEHFSFQPEVLWSSMGIKEGEGNDELRIIYNYLNIPLMAQYTSKGFYAEAGPQIGFLISDKLKGDLSVVDPVDLDYKPVVFSLGAGAGYRLPSGLGFGVRYTIGLGTIFSKSMDIDAKFNVLMLGITKTFKITGKKK